MEAGVGIDPRLGLSVAQQRTLVQEAARLGYDSLWTPAGLTGRSIFQTCREWWAATAEVVGAGLSVGTSVIPLPGWTVPPLAAVLAFGLSSFGVALASSMKSLQGFQVVMNFLMMPMFFLSGALFPLTNLPGWMTVLTRIDPASYGIDPLRRVVLSDSGRSSALVDRFALTINGQVLAVPLEAGIVLAFGAVMLGIAVMMFQRRD